MSRGLAIAIALGSAAFVFLTVVAVVVGVTLVQSLESGDAQRIEESTPAEVERIDGLTVGDGEQEIVLYVDLDCPPCGDRLTANRDQLTEWIESGEASVEIRPVAILDRASEDSDYSTRAAAAVACQADENPDLLLDYVFSLSENQPAVGERGHNDRALIDFADDLGGDSIADCVEGEDRQGWVEAATNAALLGPIDGADIENISYTPTVLVNGVLFESHSSEPADLAEFFAEQSR